MRLCGFKFVALAHHKSPWVQSNPEEPKLANKSVCNIHENDKSLTEKLVNGRYFWLAGIKTFWNLSTVKEEIFVGNILFHSFHIIAPEKCTKLFSIPNFLPPGLQALRSSFLVFFLWSIWEYEIKFHTKGFWMEKCEIFCLRIFFLFCSTSCEILQRSSMGETQREERSRKAAQEDFNCCSCAPGRVHFHVWARCTTCLEPHFHLQ